MGGVMILFVRTQYRENYAFHEWSGEGECPQLWKFKGGTNYKIKNIPEGVSELDVIRACNIEYKNEASEEYVIGYEIVDDLYVSDDEKFQIENFGCVELPAHEMDFEALVFFGKNNA